MLRVLREKNFTAQMREINHLRGLNRNDPLGVQASACGLHRLDSRSVSIRVHPWLESFSTSIRGKSTTCVEFLISGGHCFVNALTPSPFCSTINFSGSDIIRLFPNFSDAPQPIVFSQTTTTIRRTNFPLLFCAGEKILSGTKRYQPVRSGTTAASCLGERTRLPLRKERVQWLAPPPIAKQLWSLFRTPHFAWCQSGRTEFSQGPTTRQYPAIPGNTRTKVQFLAA